MESYPVFIIRPYIYKRIIYPPNIGKKMAKIKIKGLEFEAVEVRDAFSRRATQFANKITASLKRLGLTEDDISFNIEPNAMRKAPAAVSWYLQMQHLHYSHNSRNTYADNLYVVFKVIDMKISALLEEQISLNEFMGEFTEDMDVAEQRVEARAKLGLEEGVNDLKVIDKAYKDLAKLHHPDTENGDMVKFKEINRAHKMLKRELT
jgi:hypothetical protein